MTLEIDDKEFAEKITGLLQSRWEGYVHLRKLSERDQARHLTSFLEGGQAVLDVILSVYQENGK